jgi:cold shock protein
MEGKVKFFNNDKGFGFIEAEDGKDYFVHQSGIVEGVRLNENDKVTFEVVEGDRGLKAVDVNLANSEDSE